MHAVQYGGECPVSRGARTRQCKQSKQSAAFLLTLDLYLHLHRTFAVQTYCSTFTMADVDLLPVENNTLEEEQELAPASLDDTDSMALTTVDADSTAIAASEGGKKKMKKIVKKKRRPARPQVDPATFKTEPPAQTGTIFNIWYNKWSGGDREDAYMSKHAAKGRCNAALDSGYTRADKVSGSYFCLFFARGLCPKGQDCEYLHRLPNARVEKEGGLGDIFPSNVDCFGRDKFSDYRDDMGGVGSFMRVNRTLYIGRIHVTDDIEEVVARHFQEWGQIERSMSIDPWSCIADTNSTVQLASCLPVASPLLPTPTLPIPSLPRKQWHTKLSTTPKH